MHLRRRSAGGKLCAGARGGPRTAARGPRTNSGLRLTTLLAHAPLRAYLASTAFSGMGLSMQHLLLSWILVGVLLLPADRVGVLQAIMGLPGVLLMLWGGASADRRDPRHLGALRPDLMAGGRPGLEREAHEARHQDAGDLPGVLAAPIPILLRRPLRLR